MTIAAMQTHFADLTRAKRLTGVIQHRDAMPRVGLAHAARARWPIECAVADQVVGLCLAKHFIYGDVERILHPFKYRVTDSLACAHDGAQLE